MARNFDAKLKSSSGELIEHSTTIRINTLITIVSPSLGHPEKSKSSIDLYCLTVPSVVGKDNPGTQQKGSQELGGKKN